MESNTWKLLSKGRGRGKWGCNAKTVTDQTLNQQSESLKGTSVLESNDLRNKTSSKLEDFGYTEEARNVLYTKEHYKTSAASSGSSNNLSEPTAQDKEVPKQPCSIVDTSNRCSKNEKMEGQPVDSDSTDDVLSQESTNAVPDNLIDGAHEFRQDVTLSAEPYLYFFCRICGAPAGNDMLACYARGHSICLLCSLELELLFCPIPVERVGPGEIRTCDSRLHQFKSGFREFMYRNTKVSCINRNNGCKFEGIWKDVQTHQENCSFKKTDVGIRSKTRFRILRYQD